MTFKSVLHSKITLNICFQMKFIHSSSIRSESNTKTLISQYGGGSIPTLMFQLILFQHHFILLKGAVDTTPHLPLK